MTSCPSSGSAPFDRAVADLFATADDLVRALRDADTQDAPRPRVASLRKALECVNRKLSRVGWAPVEP